MTGEIAIILLTMIGSLGLFIFAKFGIPKIYEEEIQMLKQILGLKHKKPKEIRMLEQTIAEKQEEINRRNEIERLSEEIERLDKHLYPKEKEARREPLNDVVIDADVIQAQKDSEAVSRAIRGMSRGVTYEHSGPTKEEEEFYFGGNADE